MSRGENRFLALSFNFHKVVFPPKIIGLKGGRFFNFNKQLAGDQIMGRCTVTRGQRGLGRKIRKLEDSVEFSSKENKAKVAEINLKQKTQSAMGVTDDSPIQSLRKWQSHLRVDAGADDLEAVLLEELLQRDLVEPEDMEGFERGGQIDDAALPP